MAQTNHKWIVSWDFAKRPSTTFYEFFRDEFGSEVRRVHGSVVEVRDSWTMTRLLAHLENHGANVMYWGINPTARLDPRDCAQARIDLQRLYAQRLARRGRKAKKR